MFEVFLSDSVVVFDGRIFEWFRHQAPGSERRYHVAHLGSIAVVSTRKGDTLRFRVTNGRENNLGLIPDSERKEVDGLIAAMERAHASYRARLG